jgi:hypothetical protein
LLFEIQLIRLFSIAHFYHFAFLVVSIALLGYGSSGTILSIIRHNKRASSLADLQLLSFASSSSILVAFILTNLIPFDSYTIAWDFNQFLLLGLNFFILSLPFFFSGLIVGIQLSRFPAASNRTYAASLLGSAIGCICALFLSNLLQAELIVVISAAIAYMPAIMISFNQLKNRSDSPKSPSKWSFTAKNVILVSGALFWMFCLISCHFLGLPAGITLAVSNYKSLSQTLLLPDAEHISEEWNAYSRIDLVRSKAIRSFPGLSYRYLDFLPEQLGLFTDADNISGVTISPIPTGLVEMLPASVALSLFDKPDALLLEPVGGLDVITVGESSHSSITVVEQNPLIVDIVGSIYKKYEVRLIQKTERSFLNKRDGDYDLIFYSMNSNYHPIQSGAFSLSENFRFTIESFSDAIHNLSPDGCIFILSWLQIPPSESLRVFSTAISALDQENIPAHNNLAAWRGYNTMGILVCASPLTSQQLSNIRDTTSANAFDLVYLPGLEAEETNRYNKLDTPIYHKIFSELVESEDREQIYRNYGFQISPPTDNNPFFNNFYKWSQFHDVVSNFGKTSHPFGGAGYLVLIIFLITSIVLTLILIFLPVMINRKFFKQKQSNSSNNHNHDSGKAHLLKNAQEKQVSPGFILVYFGSIGFAYLLVEIPVIQQFILYMDHPTIAFTVVLFGILLFSGIGSMISDRINPVLSIPVLVILILILPLLSNLVIQVSLQVNLLLRSLLVLVVIAPVGILMGVPFPSGIRIITQGSNSALNNVPWAWAINGGTSVIASILAAIISISFGFRIVLWMGGLAYLIAWISIMALTRFHPPESLHP